MKTTLGNFIAILRKEKAMTQKELAEILGVSDKTVSHWEREESSPDISLLPLIASLFEITVDELLAGEKKTKEAPPQSTEVELKDTEKQQDGTMLLLLEQRMNELKTQNIICCTVSILALLCGFIVDSLLYRGNTFVCLFVVVIGQTMNLIYRSRFEQSIRKTGLTEDLLTPYRHKANRMSSLSCYIAGLVVFLTAMAEYQDEFVLYFCGALFIAGVVFIEIMLRQANMLKTNFSKKALSCLIVSAVSFLLIIGVIFGSMELHNNYTFGYFVRKNAEKVIFNDKESFF